MSRRTLLKLKEVKCCLSLCLRYREIYRVFQANYLVQRKKKIKKKQTQVCLTSAPVPPRTRTITSGLRNSKSTLSIIPEAHSCLARARTGSGVSAHWDPASCRTPRPHCLGHMCHSKAHPWLLRGPGPPQALLGSSWEQR